MTCGTAEEKTDHRLLQENKRHGSKEKIRKNQEKATHVGK